MPIISSSAGITRPKTPMRSVCSAGLSGASNEGITNGISEMCVISWRVIMSQKRLVDHFGMSTAVAPAPSTENSDQLCAFT